MNKNLVMPLKAVYLPREVYCACTLHALTVEKEEVMGVLFGKFDNEDNAHVTSIMGLQRSDKTKDRVEISPEQLNLALHRSLELTSILKEPVNVIGWYHSHPHITVHPSHVDLRTQASYQQMDNRFFGLIFSVFTEDKRLGHEMEVTCFQTVSFEGQRFKEREVPIHIQTERRISLACTEAIQQLPSIFADEELVTYSKCKFDSDDLLTTLHNEAAFVSSLCHILTTVVNPLMLLAEHRKKSTLEAIERLKREEDELLAEVAERGIDNNISV